ncbi:MAG: ABC transporter permease, partial [Eubacterium sp.]
TRTKLTVIAVVIGTCAIVIMVSIGIGIDKMITSQYDNDTTLNKISVYAGGEGENGEKALPFDDNAVKYLEGIDGVKLVTPTLDVTEYVAVTRGKFNSAWTQIKAIDLSSMQDMGYTLSSGSFSDISKQKPVLFGEQCITNFADAQGRNVKYKYDKDYNITECEIDPMKDIFSIGPKITSSNDSTNMGGEYSSNFDPALMDKIKVAGVIKKTANDYDSPYSIYVDMSLAKELIRESRQISNTPQKAIEYTEIYVFTESMQSVEDVKKTIQDAGFSCYSNADEIEYTKKVMMVVQLVLGAIGAISMFVAAFGISNTMVMSVYERTKEIGIMKVLGCDIKDIKALFLCEAGTIGFLGGAIGMIISYIISITANIVARLVATNMMGIDSEQIKVCVSSIPIWLALGGILFSVLIGVVAGISPAKRSVKVSALTAIHNE